MLLSSHLDRKKEYVQNELGYALKALDESPESHVFLIPVRLENYHISDQKLGGIHYVDLFPDWDAGLRRILRAMGIEAPKDIHDQKKYPKPYEYEQILNSFEFSIEQANLSDSDILVILYAQGFHGFGWQISSEVSTLGVS